MYWLYSGCVSSTWAVNFWMWCLLNFYLSSAGESFCALSGIVWERDEAPLELHIAVVPLQLLMLHKLLLQKLIICVKFIALNAYEAKKWTNCQFLLHLGRLNRPKKFIWRRFSPISVTVVVSLFWQPSWVIPASPSLSIFDWHISFRHLASSRSLPSPSPFYFYICESLFHQHVCLLDFCHGPFQSFFFFPQHFAFSDVMVSRSGFLHLSFSLTALSVL